MKQLMMLIVVALGSLVGAWFLAPAAARAETVLVTVTGAIERPNRAGRDDFADALFVAHDITFDKARAFTRLDLAALRQHDATVAYDAWPRAVTVRGPLLADVLQAAGAAAAGDVTVQALDGYAYTVPRDLVEHGQDMILAIEADGQPLAIGGRGPAWLVFPPGLLPVQDKDEGLVWALFHIKVEAPK